MASRQRLYPVPSISNINPSFKVAVIPKSRSRAEKSVLSGDEVSVGDSPRRRAFEQKKQKPHHASVPSSSERQPRRAKSKVDDSNPGAKPESVLEPGAGEPERIFPLRPASPLSCPTTNERDSFKALRLARYGGGPRNDPFSAYPIPADGFVPHAVDVFLHVWAPRQIPQHLRSTVGNPLASQLFPLALQNAGFFDAIVALAQTYEAAHYSIEVQPSREVLKHYGNALTKVRDQLSSSSAEGDDVAMLTILFLMGIHYLVGDVESFGVHLQGIHRMVDLRGGLDKLGLHGITKAMVLQIDNYWTLMTGTMSKYSSTKLIEKLDYPTHPFLPDLCASIARMPKGFRDLALEAVLSTQMLQILERMSKFVAHVDRVLQRVATMQEIYFLLLYKPHLVVQDAYACLEACKRGDGSKIESAMCFGLIVFSWSVTGQGRISPIYWELIQNLVKSIELVEPKQYETECLIWLSMVAAAHCRGHEALSLRADRILDRLLQNQAYTKDWDSLQAVLRKFFWHTPLAAEWALCWRAAILRQSRRLSEDWETQSPMTINSSSMGNSPQSDNSRFIALPGPSEEDCGSTS